MGGVRPPLRVAFWAMSAALGMTLFLALSDPYAVRQDILARNMPAPTPRTYAIDDGVLLADQNTTSQQQVTVHVEPKPQPKPSLDEPPLPTVVADTTATDDFESTDPVPYPPSDMPLLSPLAQAKTVSSPSAGAALQSDHSSRIRKPAMPVMMPSELRGPTRRGEFIELPPPPGMEHDAPLLTTTPSVDRSGRPLSAPLTQQHDVHHSEPMDDSERRQLQADILNLRREVQQLAEAQQSSLLADIQRQQETLLDHHQETAVRLDRLATQIDDQTSRFEQLLEQATRVTSGQAMPESAVQATSVFNPSPSSGVPLFEEATNGRQRFSLIIESDDVSAVLERLGRWSHDSTQPVSTTAVRLQPEPDPQPQYITPPRPDRPVSNRQLIHTRQRVIPARGPTLASPQQPCNCR